MDKPSSYVSFFMIVGIVGVVLGYYVDPGMVQILVVSLSTIFFLAGVILGVFTRLYRKSLPEIALVRTGWGGEKVILAGGALVIPFLHEIRRVSLATIQHRVERQRDNSLITGQKRLRADVAADFYLKVQKTKDAISDAARTLGDRASNPQALKEFFDEKLGGALRDVAAEMELENLHSDREHFQGQLEKIVADLLIKNGYELESVKISTLRPTDIQFYNESDVFDAAAVAEIKRQTEGRRVERNQAEVDAIREIAEQDKTLAIQKFEFDQQQATAEATMKEGVAEAERVAQVAVVARDQSVAEAEVEKQRALEVAGVLREQAKQEATVTSSRAVEVAERDKNIALEQKLAEQAAEEATRYSAEALMETEKQNAQTVGVMAEANRLKDKAIIDAEAAAQKEKLEQQVPVDVAAYETRQTAEAEKAAAENRAAAVQIEATAEQERREKLATGDKAERMVPVDVSRAQVDVREADAAVERQELENKQEFAAAGIQKEIVLAKIEAEARVSMAFAGAQGQIAERMSIQLWGDPGTMQKMLGSFQNGHATGQFLQGLGEGTPDELKQAAGAVGAGLMQWISGSEKATAPSDPIPEQTTES